MKARTDQHQIIAGGRSIPSLDDAATLTAPDGVSLPYNLGMEWGSYARLRVVLVTIFGLDPPTTLAMKEVNTEIM